MYKKTLFFLLCTIEIFAFEDTRKISESLGHLIGKNLRELGLPLDMQALVKGMEDSAAGKDSPLNEDACVEALTALREQKLLEEGEKNLTEAIAFLERNKNQEGIVSLEEGKLQYKIVKEGKGESVQPYNCPLVRCKGTFLTGETFQSGFEQELISLEETIPGFSKGILGMHEGETRTLYIHPTLGYGKQPHLNPNALLIFEIEVIKADASTQGRAALNFEKLPFLMDLDIESSSLQ
jgi:peptidylprolyl isomerase